MRIVSLLDDRKYGFDTGSDSQTARDSDFDGNGRKGYTMSRLERR